MRQRMQGGQGGKGTARWAGGSESPQRVQHAPELLGGKLTEPDIDVALRPLEEYPSG